MTILLEAQAAGEQGLDDEWLHGISSQVLLLVSSEKAKPSQPFQSDEISIWRYASAA